jgi:hypothetical protein
MPGFYGAPLHVIRIVNWRVVCLNLSGDFSSTRQHLPLFQPLGQPMKKLFSLLALGLSLSFGAAYAADAPTAQQSKMGTCNKDAGDKKGDERKAFMKECLSAKPATPVTQQSKMKTCNVDAKDMKGDERKKFMSDCLKK